LQPYSIYNQVFSILRKYRLTVFYLTACCIIGCTTYSNTLNSELITQKFGTYGIKVIENKNNIRVSNLYSYEANERICRTFAVITLIEQIEPVFSVEHDLITKGGSIGAVFKNHGWNVAKQHKFIGDLKIDRQSKRISRLMGIEPPLSLAIHIYAFVISKNGTSFNYAIIAEIHHPAYLTTTMLKSIYGSGYSGANNMVQVKQILTLVNSKLRNTGQ
jgi:hypothetical protein